MSIFKGNGRTEPTGKIKPHCWRRRGFGIGANQMNDEIIAYDDDFASEEHAVIDQWDLDHKAYSDALCEERKARKDIEKALGVQKDFEKTSWPFAEVMADLELNGEKYALLNRFEEAVINRLRAKDKL